MSPSQYPAQADGSADVEQLVGGRYLLHEQLAEGGMGVVFRATDRLTGAELALKRLRLHSESSRAAVALHAFRREYHVLQGIRHPRIIRVFDYGVDEVGPYYTMELLAGCDLRVSAPLDWRTACGYLRDIAASLALLHARNLVHRDISPGNVRVTLDGHCKLLDFGALTPFGVPRMLVGTAPFVPPEAVNGEALDQRSDLYALGALAYWMIAGRHAYPAKTLAELPRRWQAVPAPLTTLNPLVPAELDALVKSLLSADPRARPSSAPEVIAFLTAIGSLPPEKLEDASDLLQSFLTSPRFVGRRDELARIEVGIAALSEGKGCALRVEALSGMGRSRLLEETALRAQLAGACVVRVDASIHTHGSAVESFALRLLEAAPAVALEEAARFRTALQALGSEVAARLASRSDASGKYRHAGEVQTTSPVEDWVVAVSARGPLVLLIDNIDGADAGSLSLLLGLSRVVEQLPIMLVVCERFPTDSALLGLNTLRTKCETLRLLGLSAEEMLSLSRSLFGGQAANVQRFAGWLHGQTGGNPLYFLELVRLLVARGLIRHIDGLWVLPQQRPEAALPERLDTALSGRVRSLSKDARALSGRLALHRLELNRAVCRELLLGHDEQALSAVLDELVRGGFLMQEGEGYAFTSSALRDAIVHSVLDFERIENHQHLGEALVRLAATDDYRLKMEAGYHLMQGGNETEGANLVMRVCCDGVVVRRMAANLYHVGRTVAAALDVYNRQRRSPYERVPLLSALAHSGFYENPMWGERYGDEALDVLQEISGLQSAGRLRPFLGRMLSLVVGVAGAFFRFLLTPKRERPYSFAEVIVQLLGAVTALTGVAACSLDADRAARVAHTLEPFSVLPESRSPVGIYQFCCGLQQIGRERQVEATQAFERLLQRFRDPRYYTTLPKDARILYITAALFALGAFEVFRANGRRVLSIADELDQSGLKMYAMIASQLRYLYHVNRGELSEAAPHRERVELHAAHVGSAAQVERWESPALLPLGIITGDVVSSTRAVQRLKMDASARSLRPYQRLAQAAFELIVDPASIAETMRYLVTGLASESRQFIGWAMTSSAVARVLLVQGEPERAEAWCLDALRHVNDADREYAMLFLDLDVQLANAWAALGKHEHALIHLDALLERFLPSEHPLVLGFLHEARARIAHAAGRREIYYQSTREADRWLRPTGTPQLIAKCERLWELSRYSTHPSFPPDASDPESGELTIAEARRTETMFEPPTDETL